MQPPFFCSIQTNRRLSVLVSDERVPLSRPSHDVSAGPQLRLGLLYTPFGKRKTPDLDTDMLALSLSFFLCLLLLLLLKSGQTGAGVHPGIQTRLMEAEDTMDEAFSAN
ncbi:hypothetical protein SODALDRAFT_15045 [Sodiomyces alkalinus F11]|uniref:Uncharacterized protein n=1 Tax=Sodiomyces alkalinus (strain CBS 110278 / VKM F-3762 / F11) TaxID=1314773 RepID=A0A3N2Q6Q7_SODAK|nr:hypothetical protein SODALDRAFT_15045 [Sodiomyces alkalinus F11]ROT42430.1 hypothetical protein SODALDRAFT_15045 [Sodiomyces alkalinus F11]